MKKTLVTALLSLTMFISMPAMYIHAADSLDSLSAADLNERFVLQSQAYTSGTVSISHSTFIYKKPTDTKATFYQGSKIEGQFDRISASSTNNNVLVTYEEGDKKKTTQYQMKMIEKDGGLYLNFPLTKDKNLKGKWLTIPQDKFLQFGKMIGSLPLFTVATGNDENDVKKISAISLPLE